MVHIKDIHYGESKYGGISSYYQGIFQLDKLIGVLTTSFGAGRFQALKEIWQVGVTHHPVIENYDWIESEDEGWSFVRFKSLEELIEFRNTIEPKYFNYKKKQP